MATSTRRVRSGARNGSKPDFDLASEQLLKLLASTTLRVFINRCFAVLPSIVACDFVSALYRSNGSRLLVERDSRGRRYSPEFMKRYAELTPATRLVLANPGVKVLPSKMGLPRRDRDLRESDFYREVMRPQDWRHAVALCFWSTDTPEFPSLVISLNRREGRRDFTGRELETLGWAHGVFETAFQRVHEHARADAAYAAMASAVRYERSGLVVLDSRCRVIRANLAARRMLNIQQSARTTRTRGTPMVPTLVQTTCNRMYDAWRQSLGGRKKDSAQQCVLTLDAPTKLTAIVTMWCPRTDGVGEPSFVIDLAPMGDNACRLIPDVACRERMTPAEYEVAREVARGLSNKEVAVRLGRSLASVKFLLHRLFRKVGISSRTGLVALMNADARRQG